jgi:hypothetical protein
MNASPLTIELDRTDYDPGETLTGRFTVDADVGPLVKNVEVAVYWITEGKGGEDRAYQYRQVRSAEAGPLVDEQGAGSFAVPLPFAPLSYRGVLLKVLWQVRVKLTLVGGAVCEDSLPFRLGRVAPATEVVESSS